MQFLVRKFKLFSFKKNYSIVLWFSLAVIGVSLELMRGIENINNYKVFKNVFWHTVETKNLYLHYPKEYFDVNLYGPFLA